MSVIIKLDLKDKKILKELFSDARIPLSIIARKVSLSKEVVNYRVNNMIKKGLIRGFNSVYDVQRFGWKIYMVFMRLKGIDNEKESEIINHLIKHPNVAWIVKCIGNYDLILKLFIKEDHVPHEIMKDIQSRFDSFIDEYLIEQIKNEAPVPVAYLYDPIKPDENFESKKHGKTELSGLDLKILKTISHDSRMHVTEIAKKINEPRENVNYHLKKLEQSKIILKYRPSAWSGSKSLGYSWYLITLKLKKVDLPKFKTLITYVSRHQNVSYVYELIGENDFAFEIRLKTGDELNSMLMILRSILKDGLKRHELNLILKEYKYTYFPDCLLPKS